MFNVPLQVTLCRPVKYRSEEVAYTMFINNIYFCFIIPVGKEQNLSKTTSSLTADKCNSKEAKIQGCFKVHYVSLNNSNILVHSIRSLSPSINQLTILNFFEKINFMNLLFLFYTDVKLKTINDFLFSAQMDNVNLFKVKY